MSKKKGKKKNGYKPTTSQVLVLVTTILNLIKAVVDLIKDLT